MKVRWSQLVYRRPGSDNEAGLAMVCQTPAGEVMRFQDGQTVGDETKGYLALVPLARGMEEELDEWVEVDPEVFLQRDHALWEDNEALTDRKSFWSTLLEASYGVVLQLLKRPERA